MAETAAVASPSIPQLSSTAEMENTQQENGSKPVNVPTNEQRPELNTESAEQAGQTEGKLNRFREDLFLY